MVAVLCICRDASAQGAGIKGVVQDADGRPLEGVWLEARKAGSGVFDSMTYDGQPVAHTRSLSDGAYLLDGLDAGVWLFTVVRGGAQTDSEMVALVRELVHGEAIPSVPMARILRRYVAGKTVAHEVNIVLGSGGSPLRCRLRGSELKPEGFGYQVSILLAKPSHSPPGSGVATFSSTSDNPMLNPFYYYAVPDADGNVDFGGVSVDEYASITVDAFSRDPEQPSVVGRIYDGAVRDLRVADNTYELPVRRHGIVHLAVNAANVNERARVLYSIWAEDGSEASRYGEGGGGGVALVLNDGVYAVRAKLGDLASRVNPMIVDQEAGSTSLSLAMEPCTPYSMRFVDQDGKPLYHYSIRLGVGEAPGVVAPIGPTLFCENGEVRVEGLLPGEYVAQFRYDVRPTFVQSLRLGSDEVTKVVVPPDH